MLFYPDQKSPALVSIRDFYQEHLGLTPNFWMVVSDHFMCKQVQKSIWTFTTHVKTQKMPENYLHFCIDFQTTSLKVI